MIGRTLSHFRITAKLGEGGMGEVYRAEDLELKREVALKLLPPAMAQNPQRLERFRREAEVVAALNHPNIVTLYALDSAEPAGMEARPAQRPTPTGGEAHSPGTEQEPASTETGPVHFLVMELVEGESLEQALPKGGWPLARVLDVAVPIAEALAAAHEKGIVHRDLKPGNVMFTKDGRVKVLDFGLAKLAIDGPEILQEGVTQVATLTEEGLVMGTAPYMSPEQAHGQAVDARSDIFSLGSMIYEAATGSRPFHGDSTIDTLHRIVHGEPEPLAQKVPEAPLQLQWILRKALAKAPEDRYQSARDLVVDLKGLRRDLDSDVSLPTVMYGAIPAVPAGKLGGRPSVGWLAIAFFVLVGVTALAWMMGRQTAAPDAKSTIGRSLVKRQITGSGMVTAAAISPDGKYVVYVESFQGEQSLNLRQVGGAQSLQLIAPRRAAYWGMSFTPDSTAVVFGLKSEEEPTGAMYEISTLGGSPRFLVRLVDTTATFSPDGTKMAWSIASYPEENQSAVVVANADGSDLRVLRVFGGPDQVAPIFFTGPSWSPDGTLIATSVLTTEGVRQARVVTLDAETGEITWTAEHRWPWSAMVGWLPDGKSLLVVAETEESEDSQIWHLPYPEGEVTNVTSDLIGYRIISLTSDGKTLLTVPADATSDIWSLPLDGSERPRKISRARMDGIFGFDFTPDGRIVYQTIEAGRLDIAVMNADGSERQRLTDDEVGDRYPRVAPDGRIIVRTSTPSGFKIRRLEADGSGAVFLTDGSQWGKPEITPDGQWVLFLTTFDGVLTIGRVPLEGGEPERVFQHRSVRPTISPDGSRLAFYFRDPVDQFWKIGIADFETGELQQMIRAEPFYAGTVLRWTPDGKTLLTNTMPSDRANVWRLPLDGSDPERLTDFDDKRIYHFELAPDAETLVVTRGVLSRDAMLIENFLPTP